MIGSVLNLEHLDENDNILMVTPLYASKSWNTIYKKLRQIKKQWEEDIVKYDWEDVELFDYEDQFVIDGDVNHDLGSVKSRYIIEAIEIL